MTSRNPRASCNTADSDSTSASAVPDIRLDTGATGRPRRGRYSKAAMLSDIVSLADPRLWPVYAAGALIAAIPAWTLLQVVLSAAPAAQMAQGAEMTNIAWMTPDEAMAAVSAAEAATFKSVATESPRRQRVAVFGATATNVASVEPAPAVSYHIERD